MTDHKVIRNDKGLANVGLIEFGELLIAKFDEIDGRLAVLERLKNIESKETKKVKKGTKIH